MSQSAHARAALLACALLAAASGAALPQSPAPTPSVGRTQRLSRFLVARTRNLSSLHFAGGEVTAHVGKLSSDGPDFAALAALRPSGVLELTGAGACKLRTEVDLRFGTVLLPTGNVAADFAGFYSFWLRAPATEEGPWWLVWNDEADVWGTQRDPARDRVEIPLQHELVGEAASELSVNLSSSEDGGVLELRWGPHRWHAPFTVALAADSR